MSHLKNEFEFKKFKNLKIHHVYLCHEDQVTSLIYKMSLGCLSDRVAVVMDEFQGNEKAVVYRVARLVKMC